VHTERAIHVAAHLAVGLVVAVLFAGGLAPAFAATPPHAVLDSQHSITDACSICHRAHSATAVVPYRIDSTTTPTGASLVLSTDPASGDVQLCFACHGQGQLGSNKDIQSLYQLPSVHALAPATAPYGPSPIYCSTCHDSHGTARVASDTPYPKLLRSFEVTMPVYAGEAYCATCHKVEPGERWSGLSVYLTTGHYSGLSTPTTGTGIRCSWCHDPHGSAVAPLLVASIVPTAVPTTFTVTADNRTFCNACHGTTSATWEGAVVYAASGHASSVVTVPISAKWVPADGGRRVGECQVCHDPMGRDNGSGAAIPKLLETKGRILCDSCHSSTGVASTDTSSQARPLPGALTLAVVYAPDANSAWAGRASLYGRSVAGGGVLAGPREYRVAAGTGPSAAGDIDSDGTNELVVASRDTSIVTSLKADPLTGLASQPATYAIPTGATAAAIAVADVLPGLSAGVPEIVIVTGDGKLSFYHVTGSVLETMAGPMPVGSTGPWGLATGDATGTALADVAVTNRAAGKLTVVTADGFVGYGSITTTGWAGLSPVAPSIGEVWSGPAIVVCDASATATRTVRVFDGAAVLIPTAEYDVRSGVGFPSASAIGDVLWGLPVSAPNRVELAVAFVDSSGDSSVVVIPQVSPGPGLDTPAQEVSTGSWAHTGSLLIADVDGDTRSELVAGNGGTWARDNTSRAPATLVFGANVGGTALLAADTHVAGGTEMAGSAPSLALADFGPVFPSRHPMDEVAPAAHVSTETAPFTRHVTCSDCHNSHKATLTASVAPTVPGALAGAWGVSVSYPGPAFGAPASSATGYGVCFKCHSSYVALGGRPDVAVQFAPTNASSHAVEGTSASVIPLATFVGPWTQSSVLHCNDCHGDSSGATAALKREIHESPDAPILVKPYLGLNPGTGAVLCYSCHLYTVYAEGSADAASGMSGFQETLPNDRRLHSLHVAGVAGKGVSCSACHVSHGSVTNPYLLRDDIGFVSAGAHAGSCTNGCHDPGTTAGQRWWPTP
jgi:predicted CXXCH cytochrome family protein